MVNINERKELRKNCLIDVYNFYFNGEYNGHLTTLNLKEEYDKELYLVARYLHEKGSIKMEEGTMQGEFTVTITALGIDEAENILEGKQSDFF